MNNEDSTRKTSTGMHLCFSPLSKKIVLARMRESKGRLRRVGNDRGRDVTNEAARLVWEVVRAEGGKNLVGRGRWHLPGFKSRNHKNR